MAHKGVYTSDKELEDLYNSLEKESLVRMLIEKQKQLEKQFKKLHISDISCSHIDLLGDIALAEREKSRKWAERNGL